MRSGNAAKFDVCRFVLLVRVYSQVVDSSSSANEILGLTTVKTIIAVPAAGTVCTIQYLSIIVRLRRGILAGVVVVMVVC